MPFAQAFAAVITAALTGSLYYVAASPKGMIISPLLNTLRICYFISLFDSLVAFPKSDPTYVVAPVLRSRSGREDLKKLFAGLLLIPRHLIRFSGLPCVFHPHLFLMLNILQPGMKEGK